MASDIVLMFVGVVFAVVGIAMALSLGLWKRKVYQVTRYEFGNPFEEPFTADHLEKQQAIYHLVPGHKLFMERKIETVKGLVSKCAYKKDAELERVFFLGKLEAYEEVYNEPRVAQEELNKIFAQQRREQGVEEKR